MPQPTTSSCSHNHRLYSMSLFHRHQSKCLNHSLNRPDTSTKELPRLMNRRNTVSGNASQTTVLAATAKCTDCKSSRRSWRSKSMDRGNKIIRPSTHTVAHTMLTHYSPNKRVCFVCGQHFRVVSLDDHVRRCESDWHAYRANLPAYIQTQAPQAINIPSVDGTIDTRRLDEFAITSAEKAQLANCRRCKTGFAFATAMTHQCPRHEPTIHFFF